MSDRSKVGFLEKILVAVRGAFLAGISSKQIGLLPKIVGVAVRPHQQRLGTQTTHLWSGEGSRTPPSHGSYYRSHCGPETQIGRPLCQLCSPVGEHGYL